MGGDTLMAAKTKDVNKPKISTFKSVAKRLAIQEREKPKRTVSDQKKADFEKEFSDVCSGAYWDGCF